MKLVKNVNTSPLILNGEDILAAHFSFINISLCVGNSVCMFFVHTYHLNFWPFVSGISLRRRTDTVTRAPVEDATLYSLKSRSLPVKHVYCKLRSFDLLSLPLQSHGHPSPPN